MARPAAYLLDTNVVSETVRAAPAPQVMAWLDSLEPEQMYISVLTLGEIRKGALKAPDKRRRDKLLAWLQDTLPLWFDNRVLPVDSAVSACWADIVARADAPLPAIDSLLAATAERAGLVVATRNISDFVRMDPQLFDPWTFKG